MKIKALFKRTKDKLAQVSVLMMSSLISTAIYASDEGDVGYEAMDSTGHFFTNFVLGVCFALLIPVTMVQVAAFQAGNKSAMEAAKWPLILTIMAVIPKLGELLLPPLKALAGF